MEDVKGLIFILLQGSFPQPKIYFSVPTCSRTFKRRYPLIRSTVGSLLTIFCGRDSAATQIPFSKCN